MEDVRPTTASTPAALLLLKPKKDLTLAQLVLETKKRVSRRDEAKA
jgi:hypothetical protein